MTVGGQPYVSWKIKNPDPSSLTRIQISKTQGAIIDTSEFISDFNSSSWSLSTGGGARVESKTVTFPTPNSRTETTIVKNSSGQVVSKIARTYNYFPCGDELVQDVVDPDGAALKTTFVYCQNLTEANRYSRLKSVTNPDGSWEKYDYDASGNKSLILRPWKDLALSSATEANSHATYYTYSNTDGIEVSLNAKLISSVVEKIAGTPSTSGSLRLNNQPRDSFIVIQETMMKFTRNGAWGFVGVALLLIVLSLSCGRKEGQYEIARINLDSHRSLKIFASETMEVSQALYCEVTVDDKVVVPLFLICSGHDSGKLKFSSITARHGEVVGVFEERFPDEILVLHDFGSNRTWPLDRFKSLDESERLKEELLRELQGQHNDIQLKTGLSRGCV